ncbi:molybdopterin-dependent oxidoreductase [Pedosphaera parvula]|uniref:Oxidoreductase molybdopterin binding n=1 Tax=Pedosphaera parvula (strain Ellin514) TaxID=320771 RepID=B9XKI2_PEDPL|nr:molybdopterin-dependent oxidoreductase [Pedosphaera parvula]EEF59652.1 oxidoreductase molybdopterin binding [Pedosphaera parvula Ellin514]
MTNPEPNPHSGTSAEATEDERVHREMRRRSRRAFITAFLAAGAGYGGWRWLMSRPHLDNLPSPFRKMLQLNERITSKVLDPNRRIREVSENSVTAGGPRVNGDIGLNSDIDFDNWRLQIVGTNLSFRLDDLKTLPSVNQVTPLNCIEGWTTVARWTGIRLADFVDKFYPAARKYAYASLATPDGQYYVGLDAPSAFHPQTLLCYEINGEPLTVSHGAPLRLLIPTKYGIKNLKRIGTIHFTDNRPRDYWAEQGYDWFAGL